MTVLTGQILYLTFNGVNLFSDYRSFDSGMEEDTTEGSAGGDAIRVKVKTLDKIEPKLTIVVDDNAAGVTIRNALKVGASGPLIWGYEGNAAGKPKWGVTARITKSYPKETYDKELELDVEFSVSDGAYLFDGRTATF